MKLNDIPNSGIVTIGYYNYTWQRTKFETLELTKSADADEPEYVAEVKFPDNVIDYGTSKDWHISIAVIDQNGGDHHRDPEYIDEFEQLFVYFEENFTGRVKNH